VTGYEINDRSSILNSGLWLPPRPNQFWKPNIYRTMTKVLCSYALDRTDVQQAIRDYPIRRPDRRNVQYPTLLSCPDWGFPCLSSVARQMPGCKWKRTWSAYTRSWRPSTEVIFPPNVAETFSQSESNSGFNSQASIQPKDEFLVGIIPHQKQIHQC
jgi:hypothetical protein